MKRQNGLTLTELLIALILGLLLVGGVFGVYLSNQTTVRTTEDLSDLQNRIRLAFQVMSYDLRSAGFLGCNNAERVVTVLTVGANTPVWARWRGGIEGVAADAANNESIRLMYAAGRSSSVATHTGTRLSLNQPSDLAAGDFGVVCDDTLSSIFQVSSTGSDWVEHAQVGLNSTANLGFLGAPRTYPKDAMLMRFETVRWFVAPSGVDATVNSLYREIIVVNNLVPEPVPEEVLFGVERLQFSYQMRNTAFSPVPFSAALDMTQVVGVNVRIALAQDVYQHINVPVEMRTVEFFAAIRNR